MASSLIRFPDRGAPAELFAKAAPDLETKAAPIISYPAQLFFGIADGQASTGEVRLQSAYKLVWLVYACMQYRATKLIEAPLWLADETDDGEQWLEGAHPLAELLEQPNPDMEMAELLELVSLYLDMGGRALLVKNRDRGKRVASLYPFSREEFTVEPAGGRLYGKFRVSTRDGLRELGPEDVIFLRETDPSDTLGSVGPLETALAHANVAHDMRRAITAAMLNTIRPGAWIEAKEGLSEAEYQRSKAERDALYAGVLKTGKTMLIEKGTLHIVERALRDLELGPVQGDVEAAICGAFGIHPALIGAKIALENSSGLSDSIGPATKLFYDRIVFPRWRKLERQLTRGLLREVDQNPLRYIRFVTTDVRSLQEDMEKRAKTATVAGNYWTVNEQRAHTGQQPLADERGEKLGIEMRPVPQLGPGFGEPATEDAKRRRPMPGVKSASGRVIRSGEPSSEQRVQLWAVFDAKATGQESGYRRAALDLFGKEQAQIRAYFDVAAADAGETKDNLPSKDPFITAALRFIEQQYGDDGAYHEAWLSRYRELICDTVQVGGDDVAAAVGFDFTLENPRVQEAIQRRAAALARHVSAETARIITDVIAYGRANGHGLTQIAQAIDEAAFGGTARVRANRIARTETIGALNEGEWLSARASGVIKSKGWLTQGDGKVRDSHDTNAAYGKVKLDERFPNGLMHPGDPSGGPEEVINCRCSLLFYTEDAV